MLGEMHAYGIGKQETEFSQHRFIRLSYLCRAYNEEDIQSV